MRASGDPRLRVLEARRAVMEAAVSPGEGARVEHRAEVEAAALPAGLVVRGSCTKPSPMEQLLASSP